MSHELPPKHGVTAELAELVEKFYLQALNEPENRRLNDLLRHDDKARSFLLAYGSIHARLSWEYGPTLADKPLALFSRAAEDACSPRSNRPNRDESGFQWWTWQSVRRPLLVRLGWAVTALALILGVLLWTNSRPTPAAPLAVVTRCLGRKLRIPEEPFGRVNLWDQADSRWTPARWK